MILIAFVLGLTGSLHCIAMCSPLMMTVTGLKSTAMLNRVIYNAGRILTYAILGTITAAIGTNLPIENDQTYISIILGVALLTMAVTGISNFKLPIMSAFMRQVNAKLKMIFSIFIQNRNKKAIFIMGILNGILPCGLTLLALSYCITLTNPIDGFIFMSVFGVGTLPVMLGLTSLLPSLLKKMSINGKQMLTSMMIISGVILILRVLIDHPNHLPLTNNHQQTEIIVCGKK
jgi:sulfite exporter TauE/SafE